ncbi:MAG: hypothetical protein AB1758_15365, partial [Candidatus Eremiobacterota bacterium]
NVPVGLFLAGALRQDQVTREIAQWATSPDNPQAGLACGSVLRPDPLFASKTQLVVHTARSPENPDGLDEVTAGKYQVISMEQLLSGPDEVLIGFGKPNTFTVIPRANAKKGGYEKLDAFMFLRKEARMASAQVVQSGVFIRPRNLPPGAVDALRTALGEAVGHRSISCARANAKALARAGFTSGGRSLAGEFRPSKLFMRIAEHGLEYQGKPVKFDILNTTGGGIEEHFWEVADKERSSPLRAVRKACGLEPNATDDSKGLREALSLKPDASVTVADPNGPPVRLRNSRPGKLASMLRRVWGAHILWEAVPDASRVDIDKFLPNTLKDKFTLAKDTGQKMSRVDKLKNFAFSRPMVALMRSSMARNWDDMGAYAPEQLSSMLAVAGPGQEPVKYNMVICGSKSENRVSITQIDVDKKLPDWVLSKHVLISGYDEDVRFAGEIWAESYRKDDGTQAIRIHINNNSGTYRPTAAETEGAARYLQALFPGVEIVAHPMGPAAAAKPDYQATYAVSASQLESVRNLDGQTVTLHDAQGNPQDFTVRRFRQVELDTEYYDTPDRALLAGGGMLRARTRFDKLGADGVKDIEVEAKLAAPGGTARVKGSEFDAPTAWETQKPGILGPDSNDAAVQFARTVVGEQAVLQPTAWKNTQRELFLVTPDTLLGRVKPGFILSLDTISVRGTPEGRPGPGGAPDAYHAFEPQIFTKLPWTKKVTPERVAQFHELREQLATRLGLSEVHESAYEETVRHLDAQGVGSGSKPI